MSEQIKETWIPITRKCKCGRIIVSVSDRGRAQWNNGEITEPRMYARLNIDGEQIQLSRFLAEHFIPRTESDILAGRNLIDHKTHEPVGMAINDVRNLRWCTNKENSSFPEARKNISEGNIGNTRTEFGKMFFDEHGRPVKENMNEYCWRRNQFKRTGKMPSKEEYLQTHSGRNTEFSRWFNSKFGPGNQNRALYQRCYRHYKATGRFLEV